MSLKEVYLESQHTQLALMNFHKRQVLCFWDRAGNCPESQHYQPTQVSGPNSAQRSKVQGKQRSTLHSLYLLGVHACAAVRWSAVLGLSFEHSTSISSSPGPPSCLSALMHHCLPTGLPHLQVAPSQTRNNRY